MTSEQPKVPAPAPEALDDSTSPEAGTHQAETESRGDNQSWNGFIVTELGDDTSINSAMKIATLPEVSEYEKQTPAPQPQTRPTTEGSKSSQNPSRKSSTNNNSPAPQGSIQSIEELDDSRPIPKDMEMPQAEISEPESDTELDRPETKPHSRSKSRTTPVPTRQSQRLSTATGSTGGSASYCDSDSDLESDLDSDLESDLESTKSNIWSDENGTDSDTPDHIDIDISVSISEAIYNQHEKDELERFSTDVYSEQKKQDIKTWKDAISGRLAERQVSKSQSKKGKVKSRKAHAPPQQGNSPQSQGQAAHRKSRNTGPNTLGDNTVQSRKQSGNFKQKSTPQVGNTTAESHKDRVDNLIEIYAQNPRLTTMGTISLSNRRTSKWVGMIFEGYFCEDRQSFIAEIINRYASSPNIRTMSRGAWAFGKGTAVVLLEGADDKIQSIISLAEKLELSLRYIEFSSEEPEQSKEYAQQLLEMELGKTPKAIYSQENSQAPSTNAAKPSNPGPPLSETLEPGQREYVTTCKVSPRKIIEYLRVEHSSDPDSGITNTTRMSIEPQGIIRSRLHSLLPCIVSDKTTVHIRSNLPRSQDISSTFLAP